MNSEMVGKRALVTGAAQGIGKALCLRLCDLGAEVVALDKNKEGLKDLVNEAPKGRMIISVHFDLNQNDIGRETFEKLLSPYAPFHYLVNDAGLCYLEGFFDVKPATFDELFNVTVRSPLFLTQYITSTMVSNSIKGSVVNVSSQASKLCLPAHCAYCIAKASLDSLTKNVACELGPLGIRVNAVNPTVINTSLGATIWSDPAKVKWMIDRIPLGRFGKIENVIESIVFLLSDLSEMTTGHCLPVDGGSMI